MAINKDKLGELIQSNKDRESRLSIQGYSITEIGIVNLHMRALRSMLCGDDPEKDLEYQFCYQLELADALNQIETQVGGSIITPNGRG